MRRFIAALFVAFAGFAAPASANPWDLRTEYSADVVVTSGGQTFNSRVARTPRAVRTETQQRNNQVVTAILRLDRNLAWVLIPNTRNAAEVNLASFPVIPGLLRNPNATATAEGTETMDGMTVTRWRVAGGEPGARFVGKIWATAEGVVLKIEGEAETQQQRQPFTLVARNVRVTRQNPGLFELPDGVQALQIPPQLVQALLQGQVR